jgi:hypothetical protein
MLTTSSTELISLNCKHPVQRIIHCLFGFQTHFVICDSVEVQLLSLLCDSVEVQLLSLLMPVLHVREKYVLIFTGTFYGMVVG